MKTRLYLSTLLIILLLSIATVYAQIDRHTPGFPDAVLYGALHEMELEPRLFKILNNVLRSAARGNLTDTDIANAMRDVVKSGASQEDVLKAVNVLNNLYRYSEPGEPIPLEVLHDLVNSLDNTELREYLKTLLNKYASGFLTPQDIELLLKSIGSLYQAGDIDLRDALIATEISRLLGRSTRYTDIIALVERFADSLTKAEPFPRPGSTEGLIKILDLLGSSNRGSQSTRFDPAIPDLGSFGNLLPNLLPSNALTGFSAPSIQLPRINLMLIAYAAIPIAIILCIVALSRVLKHLPRALSSVLRIYSTATHLPELRNESLRPAIRNYWTGVKFIELKHGVARHPWETHREYLSRVVVGREAFKGLTEAYELAKYAQLESREIDEKSELYLRKLTGGK